MKSLIYLILLVIPFCSYSQVFETEPNGWIFYSGVITVEEDVTYIGNAPIECPPENEDCVDPLDTDYWNLPSGIEGKYELTYFDNAGSESFFSSIEIRMWDDSTQNFLGPVITSLSDSGVVSIIFDAQKFYRIAALGANNHNNYAFIVSKTPPPPHISSDSPMYVGSTNEVPDSSAILELESTTKGFLPPRMTSNQRDSIANPTPGLMIYCTDCLEMQMYNDTAWTNMMGLPTNDPWQCGDSLNYGGQNYATILIGNQCWMAENLNVGSMISGASNPLDNGVIEKYCYNNNSSNCELYGGLYLWHEAMQFIYVEETQGICPSGWHLPSDDEWKSLEIELGMSQIEADDTSWRGTNEGSKLAGNEPLWDNGELDMDSGFGISGFDALPAGNRSTGGTFSGIDWNSYFWTSSQGSIAQYRRQLNGGNTKIFRGEAGLSFGQSIRCVKD